MVKGLDLHRAQAMLNSSCRDPSMAQCRGLVLLLLIIIFQRIVDSRAHRGAVTLSELGIQYQVVSMHRTNKVMN